MKRIIRVFPSHTNMTPDDDMAFVGHPPFPAMQPEADEVHVSVTFTWDKIKGEVLAESWGRFYPNVKLGGPALDDPGGPFVPGIYLKKGVTITSRGCPGKCKYCYVPEREGALRELKPMPAGFIVQDNNLLACSREHFEAVCEMLSTQHQIMFPGGLDAARLTDWHVHKLASLRCPQGSRVRQLFLACDRPAQVEPVREAVKKLSEAGFPRGKIRCYVLVGQKGDTPQEAERRLRQAWDMGTLPFVMFYRGDDGKYVVDRQWHTLVRNWSLPAIIKSRMKPSPQ